MLLRVNERRNILHEIRKRKANWIGHILSRNCLLKQVIEGKKKGRDVTRRRGRRRKKLLDDLKDRSSRPHYVEESFWRRLWSCRQTECWMNECSLPQFLFHTDRLMVLPGFNIPLRRLLYFFNTWSPISKLGTYLCKTLSRLHFIHRLYISKHSCGSIFFFSFVAEHQQSAETRAVDMITLSQPSRFHPCPQTWQLPIYLEVYFGVCDEEFLVLFWWRNFRFSVMLWTFLSHGNLSLTSESVNRSTKESKPFRCPNHSLERKVLLVWSCPKEKGGEGGESLAEGTRNCRRVIAARLHVRSARGLRCIRLFNKHNYINK